MNRIVLLLEERSMAQFLEALLPRAIPDASFVCIEHEGKQDLEKGLVSRLRAWREPGVRFVVVRDQDSDDCVTLKRKLAGLCNRAGKRNALVRIACRELESWYLGDLAALAAEYGVTAIANLGGKRKYRDPDRISSPSEELHRLLPEYQKMDGARRMGACIALSGGSSRSFEVFVEGVIRLANSLPKGPSGGEEE